MGTVPTAPPTALVTGASSGLGREFAARLAARGHDLVLVARSRDRLEAVAEQLTKAHGVTVHVLVHDLARPGAGRAVARELAERSLTVGLLVNNAGFGTAGRFEEIPAERDHDLLMVNVVALVDLTHALLPGMLERGSGAVLNVGSTAGYQPSPYLSVYSASKTFVLNFSLALRQEYRGRGIRVTALCPGPVETRFFEVVGTRNAAVAGRFTTPEPVVRAGLKALDRDRAYVTPGLGNAVMAHLNARRPRALIAWVGERVCRKVLRTEAAPGAAVESGAR
ncbi:MULTISPECIES: SDR family NAD(P)-dependent oxidoreductase [unclassified Streptomyces]|uniref:SDR family NAD(P)-dependent oxidoreductase n=1 Tax=unclassified Streptomyces TaxID=2593676 RepID=UPI0018EE7D4D|nr:MULTISPECIES: SDR family oxidoreductase [unclassified Streptomyces]MBJ6613337.1 SDR family oxidoreductase [Streptomyces sp. I3(2020)]MBJ6623696.1 SDR family oxidoreductase [Streptomyces sp. I4(2020)]